MYVVTSPMATRAAWNSTHSPTPVGTHLSWWKPHAWLRLAGTGCPAVSSHLNARLVNVKMNKLIIKTGWDMMGLYIVIVAIIPIIVVIYGLYDGIYIYIYIWLLVSTNPSEKWWTSSVGIFWVIPNCFWKVIQNSMVPVTTNQWLNHEHIGRWRKSFIPCPWKKASDGGMYWISGLHYWGCFACSDSDIRKTRRKKNRTNPVFETKTLGPRHE